MKPAIYSRDEVLIQPVPTGPCISLILPFEPKMGSKALLQQRLQRSLKTVEKELLKAYPPFTAEVIIKKLNTLLILKECITSISRLKKRSLLTSRS